MRLLSTLPHCAIALAALAARPATVSAQQSLPLEIGDGGYLYVHAQLADRVDVRLMLDTGAGINTLSERVFSLLDGSLRRAGSHTGTRHNGEVLSGPVWAVSSLAVGALRRTNAVVGQFAPQGADGLLSMDFFRDQPFTLDLAEGGS